MTCACDTEPFPPTLAIPPGLDDLPRQLADFDELREAMLALVSRHPALATWRARGDGDFGLLLVEMWAYVCAVVALYDKVIADETYLRTAKLRPSVRRLVGLLGYRPRPAVASTVRLSLLADGKRPSLIPAGTALRSSAFPGGAPQIFELDADTAIHPDANRWTVAPPIAPALASPITSLLLEADRCRLVEGDRVAVELGSTGHARTVTRTTRLRDADGRTLIRAELDRAITPGAPVPLREAKVYKAARSAQLFRQVKSSEGASFGEVVHFPGSWAYFVLDAQHPALKAGHRVLVSLGGELRTTVVLAGFEQSYTVAVGSSYTVGGQSVTTPDVKARFTLLVTGLVNGTGLPTWKASDAPNMTVHFGLAEAGRLTAEAGAALEPTDPIVLRRVHHGPAGPPATTRFQLLDAELRGVELEAALDWTSGALTPVAGTSWTPGLALPVTAHGNVASATRGETVAEEVLGSGNASAIHQTFTLAKGPLTYVASPTADNESGVASTLHVWVDGLAWAEVPTFFQQPPDAQVFVVRQADDGASQVVFGDGVNGARLPTGVRNVVARYRFGASAATPPAGSITKIARPAPGLRGVLDPIGAAGGADAESADQMRTLAPRSALLLGRAVSIDDMEAAASAIPGVIAAAAEWRWEGRRQRPVVKIWYIGAAGLEPKIEQRLRAISDPSTPIDASPAQAVRPSLAIDVETDRRRIAADVVAAVRDALLVGDHAVLSRSRIGVGKPVFRSRIFEAVLRVPGAVAVRSILWDELVFLVYGRSPGPGRYFDFEAGNLRITGSAS